jgi:hypothetical protein
MNKLLKITIISFIFGCVIGYTYEAYAWETTFNLAIPSTKPPSEKKIARNREKMIEEMNDYIIFSKKFLAKQNERMYQDRMKIIERKKAKEQKVEEPKNGKI